MATKYRFGDNNIPHFITCTVVNWIDIFSREIYKEILIDSLTFCIKEKRLRLHAWVFMTHHIHLIISAEDELSSIVRDFKKFTSRQILKSIEENKQESRKEWLLCMFNRAGIKNSNNEKYQFWIQDNHPVQLSNNEMLSQRLKYIHENPVRSGLVLEAEGYKYSSAIDYYKNEKGILPLEMI